MNNLLFLSILVVLVSGIVVVTMGGSRVMTDSQNGVNDVTPIPVNESQAVIDPTTEDRGDAAQQPKRHLILDLSNQHLTKAPLDIFEKTNIEKLDLSHNQITGALQAEVRNLSSLRILDLSDNQFTGIPAEIGQLKNLEVLDLSNNRLTGLPYELGNLHNLKLLDVRGNNYAVADLEIIKNGLSSTVTILKD